MPLRTISHLVARDDVANIETPRSRGRSRRRDFGFSSIGPRAPYSFSALRTDTGGAHGMNLAD